MRSIFKASTRLVGRLAVFVGLLLAPASASAGPVVVEAKLLPPDTWGLAPLEFSMALDADWLFKDIAVQDPSSPSGGTIPVQWNVDQYLWLWDINFMVDSWRSFSYQMHWLNLAGARDGRYSGGVTVFAINRVTGEEAASTGVFTFQIGNVVPEPPGVALAAVATAVGAAASWGRGRRRRA